MAAQRGLTDQMPVQDAARTQPIAVQNELTDAPADVAGDTPIPMLERQSQATISTAPASLPPPRQTDSMRAGPTPACPQCESPMAWVEEHLRFYCKQCKMYF
jgi:hypothetical protein